MTKIEKVLWRLSELRDFHLRIKYRKQASGGLPAGSPDGNDGSRPLANPEIGVPGASSFGVPPSGGRGRRAGAGEAQPPAQRAPRGPTAPPIA